MQGIAGEAFGSGFLKGAGATDNSKGNKILDIPMPEPLCPPVAGQADEFTSGVRFSPGATSLLCRQARIKAYSSAIPRPGISEITRGYLRRAETVFVPNVNIHMQRLLAGSDRVHAGAGRFTPYFRFE